MGKKYVSRRKTPQKWTEDDMKKALREALKGKSIRSIAKAHNIPHNSLFTRLRLVKANKLSVADDDPGRIQTTTFTKKQEEELIDYTNTIMERKDGLMIKEFQKIVYEFADSNGIKNKFNDKERMAGRTFVELFLERHPDFVLKRRARTYVKKEAMNGKKCVENYFASLDKFLLRHMFEPQDIYNCGQLPLRCLNVPDSATSCKVNNNDNLHKPKQVTVICCINSVGHSLPPVFSFPRTQMKDSLLDHAPLCSIGTATGNGLIEDYLIMRFLEHFVKHTRCSVNRKVLLLTSGHVSPHLENPAINQFATSNGIVHLAIPPHTLHHLHPLHKSLFKPLKKAYEAACKIWMRQNPFRNITDREVPEIFNTAYSKVLTLNNVTDGFISCGVWPFNPEANPDAYKVQLDCDMDDDEAPIFFDTDQPGPSTSGETSRIEPKVRVLFTNSPDHSRFNPVMATNEQFDEDEDIDYN